MTATGYPDRHVPRVAFSARIWGLPEDTFEDIAARWNLLLDSEDHTCVFREITPEQAKQIMDEGDD